MGFLSNLPWQADLCGVHLLIDLLIDDDMLLTQTKKPKYDEEYLKMFCKNNTVKYRELLEGVHLQTLVYGEKTLMGRFKLTKGAKIPPHKHPHEQTGLMISGKLLFTIDKKELEVETGDSWCIPGGSEHSVVAAEDSLVVEIFSPIRVDYLPR